MGNKKGFPVNGAPEERAFAMPDLKPGEEGSVIEGHAAVFGQRTIIAGLWEETIARGAFDKCDFTDVLFSVNHDLTKIPLARSRNNNANSTLQLQVDDQGLGTRAVLDTERNAESNALYSAVERGDMTGMSFIFRVADDEWTGWDTDMPKRTIKAISKVYEVAAVSFPAYTGTDLSARDASALESAKRTLESARARAGLDSPGEQRDTSELELLRMRATILLKG